MTESFTSPSDIADATLAPAPFTVQQVLSLLSEPQVQALTDHLTAEIGGQFADKVEAKQQQINRLLNEAASYEAQVREALVEFAGNHGVDNSDLNDLMAELDLDPVEQEFTVQVKVMAIQYVDVTVSAVDAEAAEQLVNDGDDDARREIDNELSAHDWDIEEYEATGSTTLA